eukprot:COSAG06_NODE_29719_length_551_cov_1.084071_2_plen_126_part_00
MTCENGFFEQFNYKDDLFYQDRLRTNVGKALKTMAFSHAGDIASYDSFFHEKSGGTMGGYRILGRASVDIIKSAVRKTRLLRCLFDIKKRSFLPRQARTDIGNVEKEEGKGRRARPLRIKLVAPF